MHRTDAPNHQANQFVDLDPVGGTPGTTVDDDWLNAVQEELAAAIEGTGITLAKGTNTQLRDAVKRFAGGLVTTVTNAGSPKTLGAGEAGLILVDASAGAVTINLPAANTLATLRYRLVRVDGEFDNAVTINRAGGDVIDEAETSLSLSGAFAPLDLYSDGVSRWASFHARRLPAGHMDGFMPSHAAEADHDITITAGACRNAADTRDCIPTWASLTKQGDAAWAAGDAAGGNFVAADFSANTNYHFLLIRKKASPRVLDAGWDTDPAGTNVPAGWVFERLLFSARTDGSGNLKRYTWTELAGGAVRQKLQTPVQEFSTSNPGTSAVTAVLNQVPTGRELDSIAVWRFGVTEPGTFSRALVTEMDQADVVPDASLFTLESPRDANTPATGSAGVDVKELTRKTNTSAQVRYRLSASSTDHSMAAMTVGWIDHRRP